MRKAILALLLLCAVAVWAQNYTTTTNMGLKKPKPGATNWGTLLNDDMDVIDAWVGGSCLVVGTAQYPTLSAALAGLPTAGGCVALRNGYAETLTSAIAIGSATQQVELYIPKSATLTINMTGGVDAIQLYSGSSIISGGSNNTLGGAQVVVAATASISCAVCSYPRTTTQSILNIRGLHIRGNTGMTVTRAMLDLIGVTDSSNFEGVVVSSFPGTIGLLVENGTGQAVGPVNFVGITVNGAGLAGARPVVIRATVTNAVMTNVNFFGGSLTHPGTGGLPIVEIDGGSNNQVASVNIYGTQFESENAADIGIQAEEFTGLNIDGAVFTAGSAAGTDCIKLSNNTGVSYGVTLKNITNLNSWTNTVNDTARSVTITDARVENYTVLPPTNTSYKVVSPNSTLRPVSFPRYDTEANCSSAASPAVCAAASAGSVVVAASATTVVVNTTAVTANSQIHLTIDESLGTKLSVTCNTQGAAALGAPRVTARTAATSFTIGIDVGPTTNPLCISYLVVN